MASDLRQNIPHLIAIAILLIALLIVGTKAGLVRCSDLGSSYCDVYYSVLGKPQVAIITDSDGAGTGDVRKLARMLSDIHTLPVRTIELKRLSSGMLKDYNVVVVEHARQMSTEQLKIIKDYTFKEQGRLVWVGDAGTVGKDDDNTCKTMKYSGSYKKDGKTFPIEEREFSVCVEEGDFEADTVSQTSTQKRVALKELAFKHLEEECASLAGKLDTVQTNKGYKCSTNLYSDVYLMFNNEESFSRFVNPWNRGEYELLGKETTEPGLKFGEEVLGLSFIADDYAVAEFDAYGDSITEIQKQLLDAHSGFVACQAGIATEGCNIAGRQAVVTAGFNSLKTSQNDAQSTLTAIVTSLNSMATQKENTEESARAVEMESTANKIADRVEEMKAVEVEDDASAGDAIATVVDECRALLASLKGGETDAAVESQLEDLVADVESDLESVETKTAKLKQDVSSLNECSGEEATTFAGTLAKSVGHEEELTKFISYASPLTEEQGVVTLVSEAANDKGLLQDWKSLRNSLDGFDATELCGDDDEVVEGFEAAVAALDEVGVAGAKMSPAQASTALAVLQAADDEHPLVQGISKSITLKDSNDLPIPFVLVETTDRHSYTVTQLKVTPAFEKISLWPAVTVKDPKFATHVIGKGTVVFYAFPPETDEVFVNNLVRFILY